MRFPSFSSSFLVILFLLVFCESVPPTAQAFNGSDLQAAMADMRTRSYYGFVILLQMINNTAQMNQELTFFVPRDDELSRTSVPADHLEEFLLSHSMPMPLPFNDLVHFPSGTTVPSTFPGKSLRIRNHGRSEFYVNNAQINLPNLCVSSLMKCHGINAVIEYDKVSSHKKRLHREDNGGDQFRRGESGNDFSSEGCNISSSGGAPPVKA